MTQFQSQLFGLLLGLLTAIGCIFYEKIVHNFSYRFFLLVLCLDTLILFITATVTYEGTLKEDFLKLGSQPKYGWWILGYIATCFTGILWYHITSKQGVMVSSLYEVKYIVMMALIYIVFGDNRFTMNTGIGVAMAICSIYFISKS